MKKLLVILAIILLVGGAGCRDSWAAATCDTTDVSQIYDSHFKVYKFAWTSHTDGTVSGVGGRTIQGIVIGVDFVAGTGADIPTDLYDVQMLDSSGADILRGVGADVPISTTSSDRRRTPTTDASGPVLLRPGEIVTPSISNAGNGKKGFIYLYVW